MKAIVLAGGLGTRLRHITEHLPKPMAPVNESPFLEYILDHLVRNNIDEIVLAVSYKKEIIQQHFGSDYLGVPITYSIENEPLGTGGAIQQASKMLKCDDVVVVNGDTLFPVDIGDMYKLHILNTALLSIGVKHVEDATRFGRVVIDDNNIVTGFIEKGSSDPGFINGGVYIVNKRLFTQYAMDNKFSFEIDLIEHYLSEIQPRAFISEAYFIDIGVPSDYERAQTEVRFGGKSSSRFS